MTRRRGDEVLSLSLDSRSEPETLTCEASLGLFSTDDCGLGGNGGLDTNGANGAVIVDIGANGTEDNGAEDSGTVVNGDKTTGDKGVKTEGGIEGVIGVKFGDKSLGL